MGGGGSYLMSSSLEAVRFRDSCCLRGLGADTGGLALPGPERAPRPHPRARSRALRDHARPVRYARSRAHGTPSPDRAGHTLTTHTVPTPLRSAEPAAAVPFLPA